jgi:hypothetical protein
MLGGLAGAALALGTRAALAALSEWVGGDPPPFDRSWPAARAGVDTAYEVPHAA